VNKSAFVSVAVAAVLAATAACSATGTIAGSGKPQAIAAADFADLSSPGGADAAMAAPPMNTASIRYGFMTLDDPRDPTFNQLLGINDAGVIAGYFGSGAPGHPNKGYQVRKAKEFLDENFPNSVQTQVTAINNEGTTVGFWSSMNNAPEMGNDNTGFVFADGNFDSVAFPTDNNSTPPVNQLLGINDDRLAVGFYNDASGNAHGYAYDTGSKTFKRVTIGNATAVTAAAINDRDQIAGFDTNAAGVTEGFLRGSGGSVRHLTYPGSSMTQALGLNNRDEVVGVYQIGTGDAAQTHGFTWTPRSGFKSVDDPNGVGSTTVNGVNDAGVLVGFYADTAGNTHGMLAKPSSGTTLPTPSMNPSSSMPSTPAPGGGTPSGGGTGGDTTERLMLSAMPSGTVSVTQLADHRHGVKHYQVTISASGFTPGSPHLIEIDAPGAAGPIVRLGAIQADSGGAIHTTVISGDATALLPSGARFVIHLGNNTGDFNRNPVAAERIAQSDVLPSNPSGGWSNLHAVNISPDGNDLGQLSGTATVTYKANTQTLTVTVNATGVGVGNHAAHIHSGSCQSQGSVLYMLTDFTGDVNGNIMNETRTVTGVTSMPNPGTWYLNLHEGDSNSIVVNNAPALSFRPLLCANG
jgi:hypothetical protein